MPHTFVLLPPGKVTDNFFSVTTILSMKCKMTHHSPFILGSREVSTWIPTYHARMDCSLLNVSRNASDKCISVLKVSVEVWLQRKKAKYRIKFLVRKIIFIYIKCEHCCYCCFVRWPFESTYSCKRTAIFFSKMTADLVKQRWWRRFNTRLLIWQW